MKQLIAPHDNKAAPSRWLFVDGADSFGGHEIMLLRWLSELHTQARVTPVVLSRADSRLRNESDWCAAPEDLPVKRKGIAGLFTAVRDAVVLARLLRRLRPQLCIVAEGCLLSQPVFALMGRLLDITTVVYVPLVESAQAMGFASGKYRDAIIKYGYAKLPSAWITLTVDQAAHLMDWAQVRTPIFVLPNTVSERVEQAAFERPHGVAALPQTMSQNKPPETQQKLLRVLVLGRFDAHQKGLDLLLDFLCSSDLPDWLHITLMGEGAYASVLRHQLAASPGLRAHLEVQGWTDPVAAITQHDVLLLPSRFEGVPLVMLEAMALGTPVVASRLPGTAAALSEQCLFEVGDMARALQILESLRAPAERAALVARNRQHFIANASGTAFAAAVTQLTTRLLRFATIEQGAAPVNQFEPEDSSLLQPTLPVSGKVVSVVIPSRDGRETLQRALRSLIPNAAFIHEVIIVFSNSPEEYKTYCETETVAYDSLFDIVLLDSGAPSNGAVARNAGIAAARAPYLAFLDDDDEWMSDKLATYFRCIVNHKLRGDFVLFSSVVECNEDHSRAIVFPARPYRQQPIAEFVLSTQGGAQTSALLLPTHLAQRVGFDAALVRHQDYDFCMRLEEAGASFHSIRQPLSYWYRRGSSAMKGTTFEYCTQWLNANRHRISRAAYIAYLEKEIFAAARAARRWRDYVQYVRAHLSSLERLISFTRLSLRAVRKAFRDLPMLFGARKRSSAELLQTQWWREYPQ